MNTGNISHTASSVSGHLPQVVRWEPSDVLISENPSPQVSAINLTNDNFEDEPRTRESSPSQEHPREEIDEMNRLDLVLAELLLEEKRIKLQREKELKELCSELMDGHRTFESKAETENTRQFLALDASQDFKAEAFFEPTFKTQCADEDEMSFEEQSKKNTAHSTEGDDPSHLSQRDTPQGEKRKTKDFVRRNAELAGATGGPFRMTPAEKERLAELLKGIDEAEEPSVGGPGHCQEGAWVWSLPTRHWFTPEPEQLDRQRYINHQLSLLGPLYPMEDCHMQGSSFVDGSMSEASGPEPGWEVGGRHWASIGVSEGFDTVKIGNDVPDGDPAANREISCRLSPEQLRDLLEDCEQSQRSHPRPPVSRAMLAALLRDPYTSSFTFQDQDAANT